VEVFLKQYAIVLRKNKGSFSREIAKEMLNHILEDLGIGIGSVMPVLRVAVTGESAGIDLMETIEILGPEEVSFRIDLAIDKLSLLMK